APRNSTRFAAQYPARGLPCERFAAGLATRLAHHSGPRRLARPFLAEDLHLLFFRQLDWRTPLWVTGGPATLVAERQRYLYKPPLRPLILWSEGPPAVIRYGLHISARTNRTGRTTKSFERATYPRPITLSV